MSSTVQWILFVFLLASIIGLGSFLTGCGTVAVGCHLSAGMRNEIACGVDLDVPPTPLPTAAAFP